MAIKKASIPINFSQGLDQKTDPFQVSPGKMLALKNSVFSKAGRLTKRNGYRGIKALPDATYSKVTTYNDNLTAIGTSLSAYSEASSSWVNKGELQQASVSTISTVRSAVNHPQGDSVVSSSGLVCTAYTEIISGSPVYKYVVSDSITGQNLVAPTTLAGTSGAVTGTPRVFLLGPYFIVVYTVTITAADHLQYIAISTADPTNVTAPVNVTSNYISATTVSWDGVVANNNLFLAWNGADVAVHSTYLDSFLRLHSTNDYATYVSTLMSVTADTSGSSPIIWISFYDTVSNNGYALATNTAGDIILPPAYLPIPPNVTNITSTATGGLLTILWEVATTYTYDPTKAAHSIQYCVVDQTGFTPGSVNVQTTVGLASKAFLIDNETYFLTAYSTPYQPTYFLLNLSGKVIAKLAYSNGGGYLTTGLPNVTVEDDKAKITYLYRDLVQGVNKSQGVANTTGVYSQTGINLATFDFTPETLSTSEIGQDLHLSGGMLRMYDGVAPVEHGFHLWPDYVEATPSTASGVMTAQQYYYQAIYEWTDARGNIHRSAPSLPVSALVVDGAAHDFTSADVNTTTERITITGHGYNTGVAFTLTTAGTLPNPLLVATTYYAIVVDVDTIKVALSYADAIAGTAINLTTVGAGTSTVTPATDQSSVVVNVPSLMLTYKTATPIKIVIYRWSAAQQTYYQVTSVTSPLLNDLVTYEVSFTDTQSDAQILGNSIIYTTGGVIENIAAPATNIMALFKSRLVLVDAENPNTLWFSKQVIQNTPVEMSDLFTIYVAPTTAAQGNTGPITALSALDDKLIIFKKDAIYYVTGTGPDNTGINNDFSEPVFITSTIGCTNPQSIVFMPSGLMFQSDKGIWLLGRDLSTTYIGSAVEDSNADTVQSAVNVPGTNQVRFTLSSGITLMYDYFFGQWGTFTNVPAISSTLYQGLHTYIDAYGRAFQENIGSYLDGSKPVLLSFTTSWLNMAGLQGYERVYFFYLLGTYLSPHKLSVDVAYDYNSSPVQNSIIEPSNFTPKWGGEQLWGSGGGWGGEGNIEQHRVFLQQQKCQAFQVTVTEVYDSTKGVVPGAGLTLSGLNAIVGVKSGYPRLKASKSVG